MREGWSFEAVTFESESLQVEQLQAIGGSCHEIFQSLVHQSAQALFPRYCRSLSNHLRG